MSRQKKKKGFYVNREGEDHSFGLRQEAGNPHLEVDLLDQSWNGQTLVVLIRWTALVIFMQNAPEIIA